MNYSLRLHIGFYVFLILLVLLVFLSTFFSYSNGFVDLQHFLKNIYWTYVSSNPTLYFNNEIWFLPTDLYSFLIWATGFSFFPTGNGLWVNIGDFFFSENRHLFFLKNYITVILLQYNVFLDYLPSSAIERFMRLPSVSALWLFEYMVWNLVELFLYQSHFNLFWEIWEDDFYLYYTNDYFYTGLWRLGYDSVMFFVLFFSKTSKIASFFYNTVLDWYSFWSWYVFSPARLFISGISYFFDIFVNYLNFLYHLFFLHKLWDFFHLFLSKIFVLTILDFVSSFIMLFFYNLKKLVVFFILHFFDSGFHFSFLWEDYIVEYITTWLQYIPVTNILFPRHFGFLIYYNWYVYVPLLTGLVKTLIPALLYYLPSFLYLYTYVGFECFVNNMSFFFFENHFMVYLNNLEYKFLYFYLNDFIHIVLKPFFWINAFNKNVIVPDIEFFVFTLNFSNAWVFNLPENLMIIGKGQSEEFIQNMSDVHIIKPYIDSFFYFYKFIEFSVLALKLHHVSLNEWFSNFMSIWSMFLVFNVDSINLEWFSWLFWRKNDFFFSEERLVYILNESRNRMLLINLYLWFFDFNFIEDPILGNHLNFMLTYSIPDFFFDAYWVVLDSYDHFSDLIDITRIIDLNLYNNAYIAVLREFGFTNPNSRQRLGSLINIYHENLIEAGYFDYAKEPALRFYEDWTRMQGGPLYFDLGLFVDIWAGLYFHYQQGNYEEEGDLEEVMSAYKLSWYYDADKSLDLYVDNIFSDFLIYGQNKAPFRKLFTTWMVLQPSNYWDSTIISPLFSQTADIIWFDSFDSFFRQIYLYNTGDFIFYNLFYELLPFRSFFYVFFTTWRDFFFYGWGLPVGPIEVWYPIDWFIPHFDFLFILSYYLLYIFNIINLFFHAIGMSDVNSFIGLYMIFFSEIAVNNDIFNVNLWFFFKIFFFFYKTALWIFDVFSYWFTAQLTKLELFFFTKSFLITGFVPDFFIYNTYDVFVTNGAFHEIVNNLFWDEILSFYSFFHAFGQAGNTDIKLNIFSDKMTKFAGLVGIYNYYINDVLDETLRSDVFRIHQGNVFEVHPVIKILFDTSITFFKRIATSFTVFNVQDELTRIDSLYIYAPFNFLIEKELTFGTVIGYSTFPSVFKEFVLYTSYFDFLRELKHYTNYGLNNRMYDLDIDSFAGGLQDSFLLKWYNSYTIRQTSLPGLWYFFDIILTLGSIIFFVFMLICIYFFLGLFWRRWDLWMSYIIVLYPRLSQQLKFKFSRSTDFFLYKEEIADFMFEFGDFYFQSSDYIYLPYRKFNKDALLKRPSWLFIEDRFVDFNLNTFYKWDFFFENDLNQKENNVTTMNSTNFQNKKYLFENLNNFYYPQMHAPWDLKSKNYTPQLDYWFKDKYLFLTELTDFSKKDIRRWIYIMLAVFSIEYAFELNKYWSFKWFFLPPDFFFKHFWNSTLLAGPLNFFDVILASFGFIGLTGLVVFFYYIFIWLLYFKHELILPGKFITLFNNLCYGLLVFNVIKSARFWEQRNLSFNFFKRIFSYDVVNQTSFSKNKLTHNYFQITTAYGWGPLVNKSICLNSLVDENFLHDDLKKSVLNNKLVFQDVNLNENLMYNVFLEKQDVFHIISPFIKYKESFLYNREYTRFFDFNNTEVLGNISEKNLSKLLFVYSNQNINWIQKIYDIYLTDKNSPKSLDQNIISSSFVFLDYNISEHRKEFSFQQNTLLRRFIESEWNMKRLLMAITVSKISFSNTLSKKDVVTFVGRDRAKLDLESKGIDLAYITKIPLLESYIPDPVFRPEWPMGEYAPDMSPYLKNQWRYSWNFLGAGDENLVYRELLERSAMFTGDEQAWGFTDIYDPYDLSEKNGGHFRREFYDSIYNEKLKRLSFKETWVNFDINSTSHLLHEDKDLTVFSDATYFQSVFLDKETSMLRSVHNYPALEQLYIRGKSSLLDYDRELAFDLSFNFGYEGLGTEDK